MTDRNSWEDTLGSALAPGDVVAGKYRIERVIGRGGMGVVVQAWHRDFDERVAIKFLLPEAEEKDEARSRFEREARANFKIKSEHVARVIDVGKTEDGKAFLVMEYLEGLDLADMLARDRRLPIGDAVDFILQACDAVAEAHAQGIVHRDLKPENIFVTQRPDGSPSVKVLDFGLSKVRGATRERSLTTTDQLMGTPHYMSPEQWMNASEVGPSADLWALAVLLYELITGTVPFRGDKLSDICNRVMEADPPPMALYRRDVPAGLEAVLRACLQKEPAKRLANVGEFAVKLHPFANREGRLAAKRASGVLRTAGIPVEGNVASVTIVPPKGARADDASLEEMATTDLSAKAELAAEIRRAQAKIAADEAAARVTAPDSSRTEVLDERTLAPTLLLPDAVVPIGEDLNGLGLITTAPGVEGEQVAPRRGGPPRAAPLPPKKAPSSLPKSTIRLAPPPPRADGRPRQDTPTTALDAPVDVPSADGPREAHVAAAGGASPWANAAAPPQTEGNSNVGSWIVAPAGPSAAVSPQDMASTIVTGGSPRANPTRPHRARQGRWLGAVIALAVLAALLAVAVLFVHSSGSAKAPEAFVSAMPLPSSAESAPAVDPVASASLLAPPEPRPTATASAPSGGALPFDRARPVNSMLASPKQGASTPPAKSDGQAKGKHTIPRTIE